MQIKFYGATWCPDCRRAKDYLDAHKVQYEYIDLEKDPNAAAEVEKINKGLQSIPTIVFPNGKILTEPSNQELEAALKAINHKT